MRSQGLCGAGRRSPPSGESFPNGKAGPPPVDAVIFDLFGTLLYDFSGAHNHALITRVADALGAPREDFYRHWQATYDDRATGRLPTPRANMEYVLARLGLSAATDLLDQAAEMRLEFRRRNLRPREGAVEALSHLRALGLKLGLISDCSIEVPWLWHTTPLAPLIDEAVFSCLAGMRKPAPAIYALVCRRLGVTPDRCLYVGDGGSRELTGAQRAGMWPIWIPTCGEDGRIDPEDWAGPSIASLDELRTILQPPSSASC